MIGLVVVLTAALQQVDSTEIVSTAQAYVGRPYVYGGQGPSGVDCSGLVLAVFNEHGLALPRTAEDQSRVGQALAMADVAAGDLLFFTHTPGSARVQHVGVAIDGSRMIHASTSRRVVVIDGFDTRYYRDRFLFARRVVGGPPAGSAKPEVAKSAPANAQGGSAKTKAKATTRVATQKRPPAGARAKAAAAETTRARAAPVKTSRAKATLKAKAKPKAPRAKAKPTASNRAKPPCPAGQECARAAATRSASDTRK